MNLYQDKKSKLIEILKRDRAIFPDKRELILEKVDKLTEKQIGNLLKDIVDRHYDLTDIEKKIDEGVKDDKEEKKEENEVLEDYSQKGQISAVRKIEEEERKSGEEKLEITPEDLN